MSTLKVDTLDTRTGSGNITVSRPLAGSGASLTALNATELTSGTIPDARLPATLPAKSGVNLTALNATQLTSGTLPDARFPATLPAASGVNLTALPAANLTGTIAAISGANLTALNATQVTSGTLPMARLSGTLPALNGSALTNLPASGVADMYMTTHFSRDMTAASGTQDITGFGFNPTHIILYIAVEGRKECCFGQFGDGRQRSFSTTEANNQHLSTGNVIRLYTTYSGTNQHGSISFITDGFRITWTKNGSPTGTAYGWSTGWRAV